MWLLGWALIQCDWGPTKGEMWTLRHHRGKTMSRHGENAIYEPRLPEAGREDGRDFCSPSSQGAKDTLILDFPPPELWEDTFLLFKPRSLRYFLTAALAKEYRSDHVTPAKPIRMNLRIFSEATGKDKISFLLQLWGNKTGASGEAK